MRELTVRIRFTAASLGNVKDHSSGTFLLPRNPQGFVTFLSTWHMANMDFASQIVGRHQDVVRKIHWDVAVDGRVFKDSWHRRYYTTDGGRKRYALHEAFFVGQEVGIHCVVPSNVSDDDFWRLMQIAGQYRGLSPWKPKEYGLYEVVGLLPRRRVPEVEVATKNEPT